MTFKVDPRNLAGSIIFIQFDSEPLLWELCSDETVLKDKTMKRNRIDPMEHPIKKGESWWIVHPNIKTAEFRVPNGAVTCCLKDFEEVFKEGCIYSVIAADAHNGWVTVAGGKELYDMPQYIFARHFDAEAFVVGRATPEELEKATPFDYKPTVPGKPKAQFDLNFKG